jgi:hypothetical protein
LGFHLPIGADYFQKQPGMHYVTKRGYYDYTQGGSSDNKTIEVWVDSVVVNGSQSVIEYRHEQSLWRYSYYQAGYGTVNNHVTTPLHGSTETTLLAYSPALFLPHQWRADQMPSYSGFVAEAYYKWPQDPSKILVSGAFYDFYGDSCAGVCHTPWATQTFLSGFGEFSYDEDLGDFYRYFRAECFEVPGFQYGFCPVVVSVQPAADGRDSRVEVWPVPSNGVVHLKRDAANHPLKVEVVSVQGSTLFSSSFPSGKNGMDLELSHLKAGVYFMRISQPGQSPQVEKLVIQ